MPDVLNGWIKILSDIYFKNELWVSHSIIQLITDTTMTGPGLWKLRKTVQWNKACRKTSVLSHFKQTAPSSLSVYVSVNSHEQIILNMDRPAV